MDDQGNRLVFDSLLEALNYLSARGWELAEVYPEVDDGDSSACYLMRKKLCDLRCRSGKFTIAMSGGDGPVRRLPG